MDISAALLVFIIFLFVYLILAEVFTVLFKLMGMPARKARFQVISLMTNSGYTTSESEIIVHSKKRRRMAMATMLFGYTFTVTIVTTLVNLIASISTAQTHNIWLTLTYVVVAIVLVVIVNKSKTIRHGFNKFINYLGRRILLSSDRNQLDILDAFASAVIAEIKVFDLPKELDKKSIVDSGIKSNYGIQVLAIIRADDPLPAVSPDDFIELHDKVILFGELKSINLLFDTHVN